MTYLLLALGAMFVQQTFTTLSKVLAPVIAPVILSDLQLDAAWVGVFVSIMAFVALFVQMSCGSAINRFGAMRMCQISLLAAAAGMAIMAPATTGASALALFGIAAVIIGAGVSVSTPSSAQLLRKYAPPRFAPLVFSIKQTAVPAGLLLSGLLGPLLAATVGWRGALLAAAAACLLLAILLQPTRSRFDADRNPKQPIALSDFRRTLVMVASPGPIQPLAIASFVFNGLQSTFTSYFVIYLTVRMGYSLPAAGAIFSTAMAVAVPARILWGWVASGWVAPRLLLALLGLGMAASSAGVALYAADWSVAAVTGVAILLTGTAVSWQGVLISEAARLAPEGMVGAATGGVLSFAQLGALVMPATFSLLLITTGDYTAGFLACGAPGLVLCALLLRPERRR